MALATLTRAEALPLVGYVLDDALTVHSDPALLLPTATLVGWQCRKQPFFVGVQSYLAQVILTPDQATGIAMQFLTEIGWFGDVGIAALMPDYVFPGEPIP